MELLRKQIILLCDENPIDCNFELQTFVKGVITQSNDIIAQYFSIEELHSFFQPMIDDQVPFKRVVLPHYRKAKNSYELAYLCGYGVHTFRRHFKKHFSILVYNG